MFSVNVIAETCEVPAELRATPAPKPVVHVAPVYPKELFIKEVTGCAVISFVLVEKPDTHGNGLIPSEI